MNLILKAINDCELKRSQLLEGCRYHRIDLIDDLMFKENHSDFDEIDLRLDQINEQYSIACKKINRYYSKKISELESELD